MASCTVDGTAPDRLSNFYLIFALCDGNDAVRTNTFVLAKPWLGTYPLTSRAPTTTVYAVIFTPFGMDPF